MFSNHFNDRNMIMESIINLNQFWLSTLGPFSVCLSEQPCFLGFLVNWHASQSVSVDPFWGNNWEASSSASHFLPSQENRHQLVLHDPSQPQLQNVKSANQMAPQGGIPSTQNPSPHQDAPQEAEQKAPHSNCG